LFSNMKDVLVVASVDETRARVLLAENRPADAERLIRQSIRALERGGEQSLLAEALTTYGVVLARLGRHARSRELLERAMEVAVRDAGGSVTRASRLLGFRHHQSLIALINSRHRDLLGTRSAVRKRRHHLFSKPRKTRKMPKAGENGPSGAGESQPEVDASAVTAADESN